MSHGLVILPGLLCDSRLFGAQVEAFDAFVIDGFYGGANRIEAMARHALERMPENAAVLGHSMGGRVALEIWRLAPERVSRLALADTGMHTVKPGEAELRYRLRDVGRVEGAAALVDSWLPPMIGPVHRTDAAVLGPLRAMAIDAGVTVYENQIEALLNRPDPFPLLADIDVPVSAIVGEDDQWSPVAQHRAIVEQVPGAHLHIIEQAGHMAPAEEPERFNRAVSAWLQQP